MTDYTPEKIKNGRHVNREDQDHKNFFKELPSRMSIGTVNDKYDGGNSRK